MVTNNTQFNQLMLTDGGELTFEQRQFVDLHKEICYNAQRATESFVSFTGNIRKMKEEKRYLAAGYKEFEEYTEDALGIKQRQAYYYVSIAEKLPESFLQSNASLGVTKLALLTSLDETEREALMERINLEESSTREISAEVKAIKAERDEAEKQLSIVSQEKAAIEQEKRALEEENEKLEAELAVAKKAGEPEVVFQPDLQTVSDLEAERKKTTKLEKESKKKDARISELENELKAKTEKGEQEKKEALAAAEKQLKTMAAELEEAKAKKTTITDDSLLTFKVKFSDLQHVGTEIATIISGADEQTAEKLRNAMRAVITKWQEDMKL